MNTELSLATILSSLEAQIAHHREQEALHAERAAFHQEQRSEHAAELERLVQLFESFKASAATAAELAARFPVPPAAKSVAPADGLPAGRKPSISIAVQKAIEGMPPGQPFGPQAVMEEVNRRYAGRLRRPVDMRQVSVSLRWLAATGRIVRLQKGRPHWESKYART